MQHRDGRRSRRGTFVVGLSTALALAVSLAITSPAGSTARHTVRRIQTVQARGTFDARSRGTAVAPAARTIRARTTLARQLGSQGVISSDPVTGTVRMVARLNGFLTGPSKRPASRVAMDFVGRNLAAFGLSRADLRTFNLRQDYVDVGGTHHLSWTQSARGITVFHNGLRASVTSSGRLVNLTGSPVHAPRPASARPRIGAEAAIRAARVDGGASVRSARQGDSAALTLFPTGRGTRLAWRTLTWPNTQQLNLSVVDAMTGAVLYRQSLTSDANGSATAWEFYPSDILPSGANTANPVTFPVQDGTKLLGNNAWVYADVNDNNKADAGEEIPALSGTDWSKAAALDTTNSAQNCTTARPCTWDSGTPFSWKTNMAQNAAQVMYYLNKYHDHLAGAPYGFTSAAGNFELSGGDPVIANTIDGANTKHGLPDANHDDNANMSTPPDGYPPLMQMYLFKAHQGFPIPSGNGGDDAEVVYHEYTHGLSGRLVVYPDGTSGLTTYQSNSMGEGWSDWYAEDFLNNEGFKPDTSTVGDVVMGDMSFGGLLRFNPVDCPVGGSASVCPGGQNTGPGGFTYGDFGKIYRGDPHSDGEIWLETLWQIRQVLGATTAETLVTRAMELSPPGPSFLDMRDAILQADMVNLGGANQSALWTIFAQRGMGFFASSTGDSLTPTADFSLPVDCGTVTCGSISGKITDKTSGKPIAAAHVGIANLDSGLDTDLAADTDASGRFTITDVPLHTYKLLSITAKGYESASLSNLAISGDRSLNSKLTRDWASLDQGAKLGQFSPPDYSPVCGPGALFDHSLTSGWGSDAVGSNVGSHYTGPRKIVVKLPKAVNISSFALASDGTCGDGPKAGVKNFQIQTKTNNGKWITALSGSVDNDGAFHVFKPHTGKKGVIYVRFIMKSNHGDPFFMDVMELSVRGK